jgi:hypothetical protein
MAVAEALKQELETYEANRERLLADSLGKYVLIRGDQIVATYDTERDAINEGYRMFGNVPFFVQRVAAVDEPANFVSPHVNV